MAPRIRWKDELGCKTISTIVLEGIPARWKKSLWAVQEDLVRAILDGDDVLCCMAISI
jgi:hypothetical protein